MKRLGLLVLTGYTASAGVAHAATYYVSKSGNDNSSCTQAQSTSTPKLTIREGLKCLRAGDTLFVRAGTYAENINNNIPSGTSLSSMVRVANYKGETVWLKPTSGTWPFFLGGTASPAFIEIDGINMDATLTENGPAVSDNGGGLPKTIHLKNFEVIGSPSANYATVMIRGTGHLVQNLKIHGFRAGGCGLPCSTYGIYLAASNTTIEDTEIYDVNGGGIHIYNLSEPLSNNIVRNTRIHHITRSGDYRVFGILVSGNNHRIYNNLIHDVGISGSSGQPGLAVYTGSGNKIWNNTVANNSTSGIKIDSGASNTEVRNNIAYGNAGSAFINGGTGTTESNNLFGVDPLFMNPSGNDFKLKPDSRAVDAGASLSAVTTDVSGVPRPQGRTHDIGAHEFSGQPATSGPPAPPTGVRIVSN
jgi:parallel beta-helix repeat protein